MVKFIYSAFADEYSPRFDEQLVGLRENGISLIEVRGVDGNNISKITSEEAKELRKKLDAAGIGLSAIGSPLGKIGIGDPMAPHLDELRRTAETAHILGTDKIRMFSFYIPAGEHKDRRSEVLSRIDAMLDTAKQEGVSLCHENEKGIYGDTPERCLDLLENFPGRLGCVFDPANFLNVGAKPYPHGYALLKKYVTYFHIKDAVGNDIYPAGKGDGRIPEIVSEIRKDFDGDVILTVEPHLTAFVGLDKLEKTDGKIKKPFADAKEAFAAAVDAIKAIVDAGR